MLFLVAVKLYEVRSGGATRVWELSYTIMAFYVGSKAGTKGYTKGQCEQEEHKWR